MFRFFTLILLLTTPLFLLAQCIAGDCFNGHGSYDYESGSKYIGQFKDGQRSGIGSLFYADGSKYQGNWAFDQMDGEGIESFPDGTHRRGVWGNGRFVKSIKDKPEETEKGGKDRQVGCISGNCHSGKGIYVYPSGAVYIGDFHNGEIHGYGTCYYADGSKYKGKWANRYPHGKGTKTMKDGTKRIGFWKRGQPVDEKGNFVDAISNETESFGDGTNVQSGCISGNCTNGKGVYAYPDGSKYDGWFVNNKPEGSGTFEYYNGDKFVGELKRGQPNGRGTMFYKTGNSLEGLWKNGEFLGNPNAKNEEKNACIAGNCIDGEGVFVFSDGSKYTGQFLNRLPHGSGKVLYANGELYEGKMKEGSFDGFGTLELTSGVKVSGYWDKGVFVGTENYKHSDASNLKTSKLQSQIKIWAVIIGVATYEHMPVLKYTDDDAYRMYAFFKSPEGGALDDDHLKILIDEDATKYKILKTMREVFGKAGPNDLVLLYFSGHGLRGSFLPIDFDGFNNKLFHSEVNSILEQSRAKLKLCIADACHSGSLLATRGGLIPETIENFYQNLAQVSAGSALLLSSKSNETSLESSGLRQGVFSHFLIRGLKGEADTDNNKLITIQELYNFIYFNVRAYTGMRQSPIIKGDYDERMVVSMKREE